MSDTDSLDGRWSAMLCGIQRSIRYHQRRRAFFDRCDQIGNVVSLIFGSAAIYGVLDKDFHVLALLASALVTIISAINLVYGSAQRGRLHHDLSRKFIELERQMIDVPSDDVLQRVTHARLEIEADEPPVLHVLNSMCHNEQMRSEGYLRKDLAKIAWWQSLFAQLFDVCESRIHAETSEATAAAPVMVGPDQSAGASSIRTRPVRRRASRRRGIR